MRLFASEDAERARGINLCRRRESGRVILGLASRLESVHDRYCLLRLSGKYHGRGQGPCADESRRPGQALPQKASQKLNWKVQKLYRALDDEANQNLHTRLFQDCSRRCLGVMMGQDTDIDMCCCSKLKTKHEARVTAGSPVFHIDTQKTCNKKDNCRSGQEAEDFLKDCSLASSSVSSIVDHEKSRIPSTQVVANIGGRHTKSSFVHVTQV